MKYYPSNAQLAKIFRLTKREYYADFFITPPLTLVAVYFSLHEGVGLRWATMILVGYIWYAALHTMLHYLPIAPGHVLYAQKLRHAAHHRLDDVNFGVTSGFWDALFGTAYRRRVRR